MTSSRARIGWILAFLALPVVSPLSPLALAPLVISPWQKSFGAV